MRSVLTLAAVLLLPLAAACDDDDNVVGPTPERWTAALAGANEVPPANTTATGSASFEAVGDTAISYTITANITGVTMGHIHTGAAGVNGGVMVWLAPPNGTAPQAASGAINGQLSTGRITASWIRGVSGQPPITLDSLKRLMRTGNAYVNIHTSAFGGGEIRGQIRTQN
jgi:hypothetical protein